MRKSRVIALVIASLVSSAPLVQAQSAAPGTRAARHEMRGDMRGERGHGGALRGLKLNDTEKAKLKALRDKYAVEGKAMRASLAPAMKEARAARQKGDTAAARAVWTRNAASREQLQALRGRQQADVRAALSPENQKLFDANAARRTERRTAAMKQGGRHGGHKGHKGRTGGHMGQRPAANG
jgi:Spy/CpxP family protein refolding chaperone